MGCGDGKISAYLGENISGTVVGIDISSKMIRYASNAYKQNNLFFLEGDASSLPFHQQFDLVVSFCCFHWIEDQVAILKSCYESLLPHGKILLVMPAKAENNLSLIVERLIKSEKWAPFFPSYKTPRFYFTKEEYSELTREAGFESIEAKESILTTVFPNREALKEWLKPLITFSSHLNPELQEEFLEEITNVKLKLHPPENDGSIPMYSLKLEVQAIKPNSN